MAKSYKLYKHSNFVVKASPMTRWEFALLKEKEVEMDSHQITTWSYWDGYCCDWNGYKFWVDGRQFHEQWEEVPFPKKIALVTEIYEYEVDITDEVEEFWSPATMKEQVEHNIHDGYYEFVPKDTTIQIQIINDDSR